MTFAITGVIVIWIVRSMKNLTLPFTLNDNKDMKQAKNLR